MVSRRALLAGVGGLTVGSIGLGAGWKRSKGTGTVAQKFISVKLNRDQELSLSFNICTFNYYGNSNLIYIQLFEEYAGIYEEPATVRVDKETHDALTDRFEEVTYLLTLHGESRLNGRFTRRSFNRVSLGDTADVIAYDWLDFGSVNHVVSVTSNDIPIDATSVHTFTIEDVKRRFE